MSGISFGIFGRFRKQYMLHPDDDVNDLVFWYWVKDLSTLWQDSGKTTPVTSDTDPVGAWDNKASAGGFDSSQATVGQQPKYRTNQNSGFPAVVFDGVNDTLDITDTHAASEWTLFVVADMEDGPDNGKFWDTETGRMAFFANVSGVGYQVADVPPASNAKYSSFLPDGNYHIMEFVGQSTDLAQMLIDGTCKLSGSTFTNRAIGGATRIGARFNENGNFFSSGIQGILGYDRVLSIEERRGVRNWLSHELGISVTHSPCSNPVDPESLGSLHIYWNAHDIAGPTRIYTSQAKTTPASDGTVVGWWGSRVNSIFADQSASTWRPTYVSSVINGGPGVFFDDAQVDRLEINDEGHAASDWTVIILCTHRTQSGSSVMWDEEVSPRWNIRSDATPGDMRYSYSGTLYGVSVTPDESFHIFTFKLKSVNQAEIWVDNVRTDSGLTFDKTLMTNHKGRLGVVHSSLTGPWTGHIGAMAFFDEALDDDVHTGVASFIASEWGIEV